MSVGLGIVSDGRRPDFFAQAYDSVASITSGVLDELYVEWDRDLEGVGKTKNRLLTRMLAAGHDWLFVMEDDVCVKGAETILAYVDSADRSGYPHLMFAHHGGRNRQASREEGILTLWPNCVGAFCLYSRECLGRAGLIDEWFPKNNLEHVEHSARILREYGLPGHPFWPDVTDSDELVEEIQGSASRRSIVDDPDEFEKAKTYWQHAHPETSLW